MSDPSLRRLLEQVLVNQTQLMAAAAHDLYGKGPDATAGDAQVALSLHGCVTRSAELVRSSLAADDRPRHPEVKFSVN